MIMSMDIDADIQALDIKSYEKIGMQIKRNEKIYEDYIEMFDAMIDARDFSPLFHEDRTRPSFIRLSVRKVHTCI